MKKIKLSSSKLMVLATVGPVSLWMILFVICPIAYILFVSFMTKGALVGIKLIPTIQNYRDILNPTYLSVVYKSAFIALMTTVFCLLLGYPMAYAMCRKKKYTGMLMTLLIVPFCCNTLIKCSSFVLLFNTSGVINSFLIRIGILSKPVDILYNDPMIIFGMVYCLLPFAVLPIYSSIEKFDTGLLEASYDLGANRIKTFTKILLPLTGPGIFAAVIMVFIPSLGYYMVSDILGGGSSLIIGTLIKNQFTISRNWPLGAALSIVLIALTLLLLYLYSRIGNMDDLGGGF